MNSSEPTEYVSIIGTSLLFPITSLLEILDSRNPQGPDEVQASSFENGYSAAMIVLAILLVESTISRTQYIRGKKPPEKPVDFVRKAYPNSGFADKLEELFVVRDVIVHNHVWEAKFISDVNLGMKLVSAELREGYGDKKFKKVLNPNNRTTCQLNINLFPTRICRLDAVTVLKNVLEFFLFLESQDRRYIYISAQYVEFKGVPILFKELVESL